MRVVMLASAALCIGSLPARSNPPANDYPTAARVTYVQDCMGRSGGGLADLYKCSCVIDRLAEHLTYDQFVEASTFAHYSSMSGEGGGIFRDTAHAKDSAKLFRSLEANAYHACGLKRPAS
ncbi:MAG TPA: hypothetical protein VMG11_15290 [Steroidobacteraceae bacterium]|nr:hypothetical protein [Steroidobacteraceae bacterium]